VACLLNCEFIAKSHLKAHSARLTLAWSRAIEPGGGKGRDDESKGRGNQDEEELHFVGTIDAVA
jgi:hypothetical protein